MSPFEHHISSYCEFLENLKAGDLKKIDQFVDQDIIFSDPFHRTKGIDKFTSILDTMFLKFDQIKFKTKNIHFNPAENSGLASFCWNLQMRHKKTSKSIRIRGMSLVEVAQKGLIIRHEDYWDSSSSIYRLIPLLGSVVNVVHKKIGNNSN